MAFSDTNRAKLCQILQITSFDLDFQIGWMGARLTSTIQTLIEAQIALWDAGAGTETVKLHPKESNKGVETNPYAIRSDIKNNIAILLERAEWGSGSMMTSRIMRG